MSLADAKAYSDLASMSRPIKPKSDGTCFSMSLADAKAYCNSGSMRKRTKVETAVVLDRSHKAESQSHISLAISFADA
ncbi:hypothetical protein M0802_013029 [Mischocyttarus mexicanus]|nr:hypothetical protein M0802_013029 [Mischocyttarus mexicanus]